MTIDDQIRNEKLQYDISRETAKVSALSSKKIYKYEYLTDEEILQFNQKKIEQAQFTYSPLGKTFEKQIKTIEDQGKKQVEALKDLKPEEQTIAIENESNGKFLIQKEIYDKLLDDRADDIPEIAKEINYNKTNLSF